jgi:hypothetical protein
MGTTRGNEKRAGKNIPSPSRVGRAEEARKLLDPVLERMMEAVHHYAGAAQAFLAWTLQSLVEFDEVLAVGRGARPRLGTFLTSLALSPAVRGISGTR